MDKRSLIHRTGFVWILIPSLTLAASQAGMKTPAPNAMMTASSKNPGATASSLPPAQAPKPVPSYQLYTYYGDRYRDPFIPLSGGLSDQSADRPPQIGSLLLKGIIQDSKGRLALLTSGVNSYILKGGRLYDGRNHMMKGISGVIKSNSVVLIGSDRTVRELKVNVSL